MKLLNNILKLWLFVCLLSVVGVQAKSLENSFWKQAKHYVYQYDSKNTDLKKISLKELYHYLGQIDRENNSKVTSKIKGYGSEVRHTLGSLKNNAQVPWKIWKKDFLKLAIENFKQNKHVFTVENKYYSNWGVILTEENLTPFYSYNLKKTLLGSQKTKVPMQLLSQIFNQSEYLQFAGHHFQTYPLILLQRFNKHMRIVDFNEQLSPHNSLGPEVSIDEETFFKNNMHLNFKLTGFRNFQSAKFQARINETSVKNYQYACETKIYMPGGAMEKVKKEFIESLIDNKSLLMHELHLTNNTYNELAILALGVLFVESNFGHSLRYWGKEKIKVKDLNISRALVRFEKWRRGYKDSDSRGLTQIKDIEDRTHNSVFSYINSSNLEDPKIAAIATIILLVEKYSIMKSDIKTNPHAGIDSSNLFDYLYYYYAGQPYAILKGSATPYVNRKTRKIIQLKKKIILLESCSDSNS